MLSGVDIPPIPTIFTPLQNQKFNHVQSSYQVLHTNQHMIRARKAAAKMMQSRVSNSLIDSRIKVSVFVLLSSRNGVNKEEVVGKLSYCNPYRWDFAISLWAVMSGHFTFNWCPLVTGEQPLAMCCLIWKSKNSTLGKVSLARFTGKRERRS